VPSASHPPEAKLLFRHAPIGKDYCPLKVLQIARQFYPSTAGVERFTYDLSRYLLQRQVQSNVLTLNRCFYMDGILPARQVVDGINVVRIPYLGGQRFFFAPGVLRFVPEYDVIHIHNIDFFVDFLALFKRWHRKPLVVSTHGGFFHTNRLAWLKHLYFHTITRMALRGMDCVIADSVHDLRLFSGVTNKVVLIENGVDFNRFATVRKEVERGLLVYIGRLASNKRVDCLIRALRLLRQEMPGARLVVIGCDYEGIRGELLALAVAEGVEEATLFAGQLADGDLLAYLGRAHLFVSASEYEGFGISVLEAMSTGTVPVVNDIETFHSFITDGVNGFLVDFSDPVVSAKVMARALLMDDETLQRMGEQAREAARRYAWDKVVERFIEIYRNVRR
jgi:alpha-1,3-mannosyltransferase